MSYKTNYEDVYFCNNDNSNGLENEFNKKSYFEFFHCFYCSVFVNFRPKVVVVYATFLNSMESTTLFNRFYYILDFKILAEEKSESLETPFILLYHHKQQFKHIKILS